MSEKRGINDLEATKKKNAEKLFLHLEGIETALLELVEALKYRTEINVKVIEE